MLRYLFYFKYFIIFSSGIPSKNTTTSSNLTGTGSLSSNNQTQSTTLSSLSSLTTSAAATAQPLSIDTSKTGLEPIPETGSTHMYYYYDNLPFYENWPPPKQFPPQVSNRKIFMYFS